ncbi:MAG: glycosyl transferase [SAR86 cluster bacterium]|uniref:Glycosyl transferase n=1 Tax=SAR86 cluster bacterium TaxID=2030880 RepID=A0A2A5B063_9GAMM|nr:MAG: glycosyl transferase [SAR86 cluster bacterium]
MHQSVAVIIPTFNRAYSLARALDSVYSQSRAANEVVVVDDGSTDETREFIKHNYPDVIYLYQSNKGVSAARNYGIKNSVSSLVAFLDSDDEWLPEKLELQLNALADNPNYSLVHSDEIWIRRGVRVNQMDKHKKRGGKLFNYCLPLCVISPSSVLMTRQLLLEVDGFDEDLVACEDYDMWLNICCKYSVLFIDQPLLRKYGGHEDQLSAQHWGMDRFRVRALEKLINSAKLSEEQTRKSKDMLITKSRILKNGASKRGNTERADYYQELIRKYSDEIQES